MKKLFLVSAILGFAVIALAGQADARGCVRGAIVGGIVGHFVGHGGLGAAAGCAYGIHRGTAMIVKTATRADRATNSVAEMGSAMGMIDTERDWRQAAQLLAASEG
jgi:hypothetical protein